MSANKRFFIFAGYASAFILMMYILLMLIPGESTYVSYEPNLRNHFRLQINGADYPNASSQQWYRIKVTPDDVITLKTRLPEDTPNIARLNFNLLYSAVKVSVDDKEIYSYGIDRRAKNLPLGCGYHMVKLPKNYPGKTLSLEIFPSAHYKISYIIQDISLGNNQNIIVSIVRKNMLTFMTALFLIPFGVLLFVLFFVLFILNIEQIYGLLYLSVFTFTVGLWGLGSLNFIQIFNDHIVQNSYLEYFSFYLIFPSCFFVIADLKQNNRFEKGIRFFKVFFVLFVLTVFFCQIFHIRHYNYFLTFYQLSSLPILMFLVVVLGSDFSSQPAHEKILCTGSIGISFVVSLQIILYNMTKYFDVVISFTQNALLYLNMLIVVSTLLLSYTVRFFNNTANKRELEILEKMAYRDSMTELGNRKLGMLELEKYDRIKQPYCLLLFDLNNLKIANDSYGHARGDKMIQDFSQILQEVFTETGSIHRIGGDEFLVILPQKNRLTVKEYFHQLEQILDRKNRQCTDGILLEAAYGIADSSELESFDYEKVFRKADERMYAQKYRMKNKI